MRTHLVRTACWVWLLAAAGSGHAQEKVGIEACDAFLVKYEACIAAKVPAAAQAPARNAANDLRAMWRILAADPVTKARVVAICEQTIDAIKQQVAPLGCAW
jgi:hypothetical protein